jgi:hypothetical protein
MRFFSKQDLRVEHIFKRFFSRIRKICGDRQIFLHKQKVINFVATAFDVHTQNYMCIFPETVREQW